MGLGSAFAQRASVVSTWGSTDEERRRPYACDHVLPEADVVAWRAIDVDAPSGVMFRRLCQLRVAPYSYDWIDNFGRTSPARLTPGAESLAVGQRFMRIFTLVEFEPGRQVTLRLRRPGPAGDGAVTYQVDERPGGGSRLVVKLRWRTPPGLVRRRLIRATGASADLVMMRRQLLNLARLAEQDAWELAEQDASVPVASRPCEAPRRPLLPPPRRPADAAGRDPRGGDQASSA